MQSGQQQQRSGGSIRDQVSLVRPPGPDVGSGGWARAADGERRRQRPLWPCHDTASVRSGSRPLEHRTSSRLGLAGRLAAAARRRSPQAAVRRRAWACLPAHGGGRGRPACAPRVRSRPETAGRGRHAPQHGQQTRFPVKLALPPADRINTRRHACDPAGGAPRALHPRGGGAQRRQACAVQVSGAGAAWTLHACRSSLPAAAGGRGVPAGRGSANGARQRARQAPAARDLGFPRSLECPGCAARGLGLAATAGRRGDGAADWGPAPRWPASGRLPGAIGAPRAGARPGPPPPGRRPRHLRAAAGGGGRQPQPRIRQRSRDPGGCSWQKLQQGCRRFSWGCAAPRAAGAAAPCVAAPPAAPRPLTGAAAATAPALPQGPPAVHAGLPGHLPGLLPAAALWRQDHQRRGCVAPAAARDARAMSPAAAAAGVPPRARLDPPDRLPRAPLRLWVLPQTRCTGRA